MESDDQAKKLRHDAKRTLIALAVAIVVIALACKAVDVIVDTSSIRPSIQPSQISFDLPVTDKAAPELAVVDSDSEVE